MAVVEVEELARTYRTSTGILRRRTVEVEAVRGVSFEIPKGELLGLAGREREKVEGYSRGMRQRLHIARGLLHDPEVVFLDEPTIGVDPVGARELRATIAGLTDAGKTVLLTTHYMFEADALCDRIAVIDKGQIVAEGTPEDLKATVAERTIVEIEAYGASADAIEALRRVPGVTAVSVEEHEQRQLLLVQ